MSFEFARQVAHVPLAFERSNRSTACLLKDAGFPASAEGLSVDDVAHVLEEDPHLADLWLERGHDQRVAGGWGIEETRAAFIIKNFHNGQTFAVNSRARACAEFVVRYVGHIRAVLARTS